MEARRGYIRVCLIAGVADSCESGLLQEKQAHVSTESRVICTYHGELHPLNLPPQHTSSNMAGAELFLLCLHLCLLPCLRCLNISPFHLAPTY